ncbi:peptidoglycan-binding protein [Candidatus Poriferisocius sp.]|uniref:peptidoglycan-binding protein n=1 Tax=Candidatus Poriferisocius sp. TaxID=3101276 RepID=UPI003B59A537
MTTEQSTSPEHSGGADHTSRRRTLPITIAVLALVGAGVAAWLIGTQDEDGEPGSAPTLATATIEVRDLSETTTISGTLAFDDPIAVTAPAGGVVADIRPEGTVIDRGAILYTIDRMVTDDQLREAEQRVTSSEASKIGAEIAIDRLQASVDTATLASAQASAAQAQLSLDSLLTPATPTELNAAQAAITRAQQTIDDLLTPATPTELNAAQAAITRAQQTLDDLLTPATPTELNAAQAAITRAQQQLTSSQAALDLSLGDLEAAWDVYCRWPDVAVDAACDTFPLDDAVLTALSEDIARLQNDFRVGRLWLQQSQDLLDAGLAHIADEAAVQSARADLDTAEQQLQDLQDGPTQSAIDTARADLDTAEQQLQDLQDGPTQSAIDTARADLDTAEQQLQDLQDGPDPLQVEQARANLMSANARLDDLLADPDVAELAQAQLNLEAAQISQDMAQNDLQELRAGIERAVALYGGGSAWRTLSAGVEPGPDVVWLETNLAALGYGGFDIDEEFDQRTARAVSDWQADSGLPVTGDVPLGQVVFVPGPAQVGSLQVSRGDPVSAGTVLYELTALELMTSTVGPDGVQDESVTTQRVTTQLDLTDRDLLDLGTLVEIELPDGTTVAGRVSDVGDVPVIVSATNQTSETSYLDVAITPLEVIDPNWTGATIDIIVATEVAQGVLTTPVSGLLALMEGGYAVEVIRADGTVQLVGVSTGMFADGFVEIAGEGLAPGTVIVVP